jgi:hypothetical protein
LLFGVWFWRYVLSERICFKPFCFIFLNFFAGWV